MLRRRHAFVTGGTGFIGINLIRVLLELDWKVTALHRSTSDLRYLGKLPVKRKKGSVTDIHSLYNAVPGNADAVFHLAGDTNLWSEKNSEQTRINLEGTRNVLEAALSKNAQTFIHTSSASAWGEMTNRHVSEGLPQKGRNSWVNYERTKWAGEQEVLKYSDSKMKVVVLNPTTVTGPYDINNWGKLFLALKHRRLPGIPDGVVSVTHVREVAKAHVAAVDRGKKGNNYILSGEDCTISRFISEIACVSGIKKIPGKIPTSLLRSLAHVQTFVSSITGKKPTLTPELVKLMTRKNISYSSNKAIADLGYKIVPMKTSVRDCYDWLTREGYL